VLAACGARTELGLAGGAGGSPGGPGGATTTQGSGASGGQNCGGGQPLPSGVVLAKVTQTGASNTYGAFATFSSMPSFTLDGCPSSWPSAGSCCCMQGISTPAGPLPDAGTVTLTAGAGGALLATLTPSSGTGYGSWDLGVWGAIAIGDYAPVVSQAWSPGETLSVVATGGQAHAFSGALRTPGLWSGVMPPIGPAAVAVDRSHDFVVSWAPEGQGGESVLLSLQQIRSNGIIACFCHVPDAAATVSVDTTLLGKFGTQQLMGSIRLERLVTSIACSDDATIALVGEALETADATFH
jgi:hypothetical protein